MRLVARFVVLFWLCLLPLAAVSQTAEESDSGWLSRLIESNLSSAGRSVVIYGFEGALSSTATITKMTIADNEGIWLEAENLRLQWNRAALLRGRIDIREMSAGQITLFRRPISEAGPPSPEASPFSLPELPVSVNIGLIKANRITLGEAILGREISLGLQGQVDLVGGIGNVNLTADRLEGPAGSFALAGSYSNQTQILSVDLRLDEAEGGILSTLLSLPGDPSVSLELAGTGPISDYRATLLMATDGETRITGEAGLVSVPDPAGGSPAQDFRLNVRGDVTTLIAPQYREFFGPDVRLSVQGSRDGDGAITLSLLDVGAQSLTLRGSAAFQPDFWPRKLSLTGKVAALDGSPVALPGGAGTTLRGMSLYLNYDADSGNAWSGDFLLTDLQLPGATVPMLALTGEGVIVPASDDQPGSFTANMAYQTENLGFDDAALATALGDRIGGEIRLSRQGEDPFRISRLTVSGPGIEMDAEGTIAGPASGFLIQSSVMLKAADASRFGPLTGLDLGGSADVIIVSSVKPLDRMFDVILTGNTIDLSFGIDALDPLLRGDSILTVSASRDTEGTRIDGLSIATPALRAEGSVNLTSGPSDAVFDMTITDMSVSLPGLNGPGKLQGTASRAVDGVITADVNATLPGSNAAISLNMAAPEDGGLIIASALADVADLSPYGVIAGRPLSGKVELIVSGQGQPDASLFDVTVFGRTDDVTIGLDQVDALLAGAGMIDGRITRDGPESLRMEGFSITTAALDAKATVNLIDGVGDADLDIGLTDIAPFVPGLTGPARVSGTAERDLAGIVTLDLSGTAPGAEATIAGTVAPPSEGNAFNGTIGLNVVDLGPFAAIAGQNITGGLQINATGMARPDLTLVDLKVDGQTQNLQTGLAALDPLLAGNGSVTAAVRYAGMDDITVRELEIAMPGLRLTGEADQTKESGQARIDLTVPEIAPIAPGFSGPLTLSGTVSHDAAGVYTLGLNGAGPGTTATVAATIAGPDRGYVTNLDVSGSVANLSAFSNILGRPLGGSVRGRVSGTITPDANAFDLVVDAQSTNLDPGSAISATLLRGTGTLTGRIGLGTDGRLRLDTVALRFPNFTVNADISGGRDSGQARFDARLADIALLAPQFNGPATLSGTANLNSAGIWQMQMRGTGSAGTQLAVQGTVSGTAGTGLRLNLAATGQAPLGLANGVIDPNRIDGMATFDLRVNGAPSLNAVSGTVRIAGARAALPDLRMALPGVNGSIAIAGGRATVDVRGTVEGGGDVVVNGTVGLSNGFPANLTVRAGAVTLRDATLYETEVTGTVTVTGPLTGGALIAGTLNLGQTELQVPSSGIGILGSLPVVMHFEPSQPVVQTLVRAGLGTDGTPLAGASGGPGPVFRLDLTISAPSRVFIRGRGLDAELGGEIGIGGTTQLPVTQGEFRLIRGRLVVLTRRFELTDGSASLQGDFIPWIRLVAESKARTGTDVFITVEGPATAPEVSFTSNPSLPEDEVLAQLLFGADLASVTPLQAIELAAAVATLAGRGSGGLIDGLRTGAGLDDLDITTDDEGKVAVRLGRYLTDRIYTDVIVGTTESEINLNFEVNSDLTVTGTVTSEGGAIVGLYFERDY
jgi:translocation and assembly module TamB